MGLEASCTVHRGRQSATAKVHLDKDAINIRGALRLDIPFSAIKKSAARQGVLEIVTAEGATRLDLGPAAEKWLLKIRYPRSLTEKLGLKQDSKTLVLGVRDDAFEQELEDRGLRVSRTRRSKDADIVLFAAESEKALGNVAALRTLIKPSGAIWVVYPKGMKHVTEAMVRRTGIEAGLVDVKIVSFSETHTGLKFMIPRAAR